MMCKDILEEKSNRDQKFLFADSKRSRNFRFELNCEHMNLQDYLIIVGSILGPILTAMGFMWHHSNTRFEKIDEKFEKIDEKISTVEKRLGEKIDAVRDRVSRIEGQLAPASFVTFNAPKNKENIRSAHSSS